MSDLRHGLRFKTPRNAEIFEKWLNDNCAGYLAAAPSGSSTTISIRRFRC